MTNSILRILGILICLFVLLTGTFVGIGCSSDRDLPALHRAVIRGDMNTVKILLALGINVNSKDARSSTTPLHWAVFKGDVNLVKLFLTKGANVNAQDRYFFTPLHYATIVGRQLIAELLLDNGAELDTEGEYCGTPLHCAADQTEPLLLILVDRIDEFHSQDKVQINLHEKQTLVNLLLLKGANPNIANNAGEIPLHAAARSGEITIVDLLLAKTNNVNVKDSSGWTPLHYAARYCCQTVIEILLSHGALIQQTNDGETPWQLAMMGCPTERLDTLRSFLVK